MTFEYIRERYMLEGRRPVLLTGYGRINWDRQFHGEEWVVGRQETNDVHVSTVFIGIPMLGSTKERPLLFETMVFGGEHDEAQERYSTWEEAEAGHKRWCARVFSEPTPERAVGVE